MLRLCSCSRTSMALIFSSMAETRSSKFMSNPFGVNGVWKLHCIHCGLLPVVMFSQEAA